MTDLSKLTAKDFSDAMHKGWEGLRHCKHYFFLSAKKRDLGYTFTADVKYMCAIGAMAHGTGSNASDVWDRLKEITGSAAQITIASNAAGNKRAAMKAVDAILLGETT